MMIAAVHEVKKVCNVTVVKDVPLKITAEGMPHSCGCGCGGGGGGTRSRNCVRGVVGLSALVWIHGSFVLLLDTQYRQGMSGRLFLASTTHTVNNRRLRSELTFSLSHGTCSSSSGGGRVLLLLLLLWWILFHLEIF